MAKYPEYAFTPRMRRKSLPIVEEQEVQQSIPVELGVPVPAFEPQPPPIGDPVSDSSWFDIGLQSFHALEVCGFF